MEITREPFCKSLAEVGKKYGVEDLTLSEVDEVFLKIEDVEMTLAWSDQDREVQYYAILDDLPDAPSEMFFKLLLQANNFQFLTRGGAIGYDPDEEVVTMNLRQPAVLLDGKSQSVIDSLLG